MRVLAAAIIVAAILIAGSIAYTAYEHSTRQQCFKVRVDTGAPGGDPIYEDTVRCV